MATRMTREEVLANPEGAAAALKAAEKAMQSPLPVADPPPEDVVTLPGGLMHKGRLIKHVTVRELNGEDEERLARALRHPNDYHFMDVLLRCGVERLADLGPDDSQEALGDLLAGDRDEIILGIRAATYGDEVEVFDWICPECGEKTDRLAFSLKDDVKRVKLKDPAGESVFEVSLRRGARAKLRLATGSVQLAVYEADGLSAPQRNDVMLSKCVETYTDRHGTQHLVPGNPGMVRLIPAADRQKILRELAQRQPGPRYNDVRFEHEGCGKEVSLAPGITDLFRDLIAALL